jgi:hypothetical protein
MIPFHYWKAGDDKKRTACQPHGAPQSRRHRRLIKLIMGGIMEVRLKQEWMGHHAGTIIKVSDSCANLLFQKDTAEKMEPETKEKIREKLYGMAAKNRLKSSPEN